MSLWHDQFTGFVQSPVALGAGLAALTAFIRTHRARPAMRFVARVGEALTCSLLSTMCTYALQIYYGVGEENAILIGVFCGALGTDTIIRYLALFLDRYLVKFLDKWLAKQNESDTKSDSESR